MEVDTSTSPVVDVQTGSAGAAQASPLSVGASPLQKIHERTKSQTIKMNSAQLQAILVTIAALQDTVEELQDDLKATKDRLKKNQSIIKALWKRQQGSDVSKTDQSMAAALDKLKAGATNVEESKDENDDEKYLNRRIAKDIDGEIIFGTINESWVDGTESRWHVVYDNADEEDLDKSQLMAAISLYSKKKNDDPRSTIEENQEKQTMLQSQPKESVATNESSSITAATSLIKGVEYTEAINEINRMTENSVDSISDAAVNGIEKITMKTADGQNDITGLTDSSMDSISDATVNGIEKITSKTADSLSRIEEVSTIMHGDFSNNCKAEVEKTTATLNIRISKADELVTKIDKLQESMEDTMSRAEEGLANMPQQSGGSGVYSAIATSELHAIVSGRTPTTKGKSVERTKSLPPRNDPKKVYSAKANSMLESIMNGSIPIEKPPKNDPQNDPKKVYSANANSMLESILNGSIPIEKPPKNDPQRTDAYSVSMLQSTMKGSGREEYKEAGSRGSMVNKIINGSSEPKKKKHIPSIYDPNPYLSGWPYSK